MEGYVILWRFNDRNKWHLLTDVYSLADARNKIEGDKKYDTTGREYKIMMLREPEIQ